MPPAKIGTGYNGTVTKLEEEEGEGLVAKRMSLWRPCFGGCAHVISAEAVREVLWYMFSAGCGLPCLPATGTGKRARSSLLNLKHGGGGAVDVDVVMPEAATDLFEWAIATDTAERIKAVPAIVDELLLALHHLHRSGLSHGDVKPENLVLVRDDVAGTIHLQDGLSYGLRLVDLGSMRLRGGSGYAAKGTMAYLPDEMKAAFASGARMPPGYDGAWHDAWSAGATIHALVFARSLPADAEGRAHCLLECLGKMEALTDHPALQRALSVMICLLGPDPKDRSTPSALLSLINGGDPSYSELIGFAPSMLPEPAERQAALLARILTLRAEARGTPIEDARAASVLASCLVGTSRSTALVAHKDIGGVRQALQALL